MMKYRTLGRSGLKVSVLSMGTFTFGGEGMFSAAGNHGVEEARKLVATCLDAGINLFDTSNMYSTGRSEEILAEALGSRRPDVLISSKARMRIGSGPNDEGVSRYHLIRECERSLKRLKTDFIDIYYMHEWDGLTPLEEMLHALDSLISQGKIRYIGCSNYTGWQLMKSLGTSNSCGYQRFVTQQIHYTLEAREAEYELLPISVDQGLGVLVWSPLAGGLLTGAHRRGQPTPPGSRQAKGWSEPPIRDEERLWNIVDELVAIAQSRGVTPAQVALAWLLDRPAITSLVVGGVTQAHFRDNICAVELELTAQENKRLDEVSAIPSLYPYWHQFNFARDRFSQADWALQRNYMQDGRHFLTPLSRAQ